MLPAQALAANPDISVTFVGVTRRYQQCQEGVQAQANAASAIQYRCLAPEHFVPAVSALRSFVLVKCYQPGTISWHQSMAGCQMPPAGSPDLSLLAWDSSLAWASCRISAHLAHVLFNAAPACACVTLVGCPLLVCQEVSVWQCRKAGKEESEFLQPTRRQHWLLWR